MSRSAGSRRTCRSPPPSPWTAYSQKSTARTLTITAATTGGRNSGRSSVPAALTARSGSSVRRARSASSGLARGGAAGAPSAATMPRGASLAVMRWRTWPAVRDRPRSSLTSSAMAAGSREPSIRQVTRYSSRDIWMTWPSARRTSDGGWL